ncbi:MAG: S-methyl-5-thioribose-1-phosphate isomerase [Leptospirales bacterium]|nr:S-methyl-5-thioribose-1-phosphate isomerase [Leptospirales bacterium]
MIDLHATSLRLTNGSLSILDQTRLPTEERWLQIESVAAMVDAIQRLAVRGAPLIAIAAALMLAKRARDGAQPAELRADAARLRASRPTAVNLMRIMDRLVGDSSDALLQAERLQHEAEAIFLEDQALCERMAEHGAKLIGDGQSLLTHCATGGLSTAGAGTALGAILRAHRQAKNIHVYVDETRPLLQGARLTAWELTRSGVPCTLIADNMAASLMRNGQVDAIFVGADRIALNGDFANKIGTYALAALAKYHGIPFYCVAPETTIDPELASGAGIPIEERDADELRGFASGQTRVNWAPAEVAVFNPAFDITPGNLLTALVMDRGVFSAEQIQNGALGELYSTPASSATPPGSL